MQNLTIDFATLGDLKIVEKPTTMNVAPHAFKNIKVSLKVSSSDTSMIFGSITYDSAHGEGHCVVLNEIHVDIVEYIRPSVCAEIEVFLTL